MNDASQYNEKSREELIQELITLKEERDQIRNVLTKREKEKEITDLIDTLVSESERNIDYIVTQIISIIFESWADPNIVSVRITLGDNEWTSANFRPTSEMLSEVFQVERQNNGCIELFYSEERSPQNQISIRDERDVLHIIAVKLGKVATEISLETKFDVIFHESPVAVCTLDLDHGYQIVDVNDIFTSQTGFSRDQLLGAKLPEIVLPEPRELLFEIEEILRRDGFVRGFPIKANYNGKVIKQLAMNAKLVVLRGRKIVIASFVDLTEIFTLKEAEKASNEFNRILIEALPLGLDIMDQSGEVLYANGILKDMFGDDLVGKACWNHHNNNGQPCDKCPVGKEIKVGETYTTEINTDGGLRCLQVTHTGFKYKNKPALLNLYVDISKRKKAEKELRDANEKLQVIFDNMDDAYLQIDRDARITYVNPAAPRMFGYASAEEMIGLKSDVLYGKQSDPENVRGQMAQNEHIHDETYLGRRKDGSVFWVSMNARYLYDEEGNIVGRQGVVRDITQRHEFKQELIRAKEIAEKNEQNLNEAQELAKIGSWEWTKEDDTLNWSREVYKLLKMDPSQPAPRKEDLGFIYGSEEEYKQLMDAFWKCLEDGTPYDLTLKMVRSDGSRFYTRTNGRLIKDENGTIIGVRGTVQDIDARKRLQDELTLAKERAERNERKLNEAQVIARIGSWDWLFEPETVNWSPTIYDLLGLDPNSPAPSYEEAPKFYTPESFQKLEESIKNCLETQEPFMTELEMIRQDGSITQVLVRGREMLDEEGKVIGLQGTVQDINAQKALEADLIKAKEKAEESSRLKTAFLLNMSHEIRTPMNGILGFMSFLNEPDLEDSERTEFINIINKSGERLMSTINDLLEISKIEIGDVNLQIAATDVAELMKYHFDFFTLLANEKGVILELNEHITGEQAVIRTDRQKLDSILMNLIKNAVKFTEEGSIEFGNFRDGDHLCFYVKDTGIGIPEEKLPIIFDRFVQADLGLSRGYEGTGIGLSIAKAYAEALDGSIEVESTPGVGTQFLVKIPYMPVHQPAQAAAVINGNDEKTKHTILAVEDNEVNRCLLEKIFDGEFNLLSVGTGAEAIERCAENPSISLVLMDIKMPGEYNGIEASRKIREINPELPIVAQTAYAIDMEKDDLEGAGFTDYIAKPYNKRQMLSLVQRLLK